MMWKKLAISSLLLWILTIGVSGYFFLYGTSKEVDGRVEITLAPEEREIILKEMRMLLEGVQGIIKGLSDDDFQEVAKAARGNGMQMAQDVNPTLMGKLPKSFMEMGVSTHKDFDVLAKKAPQMNKDEVLRELGTIMNSCVGCHNSYKIVGPQ